jgi:hypothetical protein
MKHFIVTLLIGFFALGPHSFGAVSHRNGIAIASGGTINGITPVSHVNGFEIGGGGGYVAQITRGDGTWGDAMDFSFYTRMATEFTPGSSFTVTAVDLWMREIGTPAAGTITVAIYDTSSNLPNAQVGTASATIDRTTFPTSDTPTLFTGISAAVTSGTKYWIVVISSTADSGVPLIWTNISGAFLRKYSETGASWDSTTDRAQNFVIYSGSP